MSCVTQETQAPQAPAAPLRLALPGVGGGGKSTALSRLTSHINRSKVDVERMERKRLQSQAPATPGGGGWGGQEKEGSPKGAQKIPRGARKSHSTSARKFPKSAVRCAAHCAGLSPF